MSKVSAKWIMACAVAGWLAVGGPAQAAMYKWVDDNGVTQYTQYPPPDRKVETMVPPPTPAQDPGGAHQKLEATLQQLDEKQKTQAETEAEQNEAKAEAERVKKKCEAARSNLDKLTTGGRKRVIGPDGVATYLTDEERQSRIDEARTYLKDNCGKK